MGLFDRMFGNDRRSVGRTEIPRTPSGDSDEQAIARYRYLIRTAPPEAIEQAHAEAFARLTPEQRRRVLDELAGELPAHEREAAIRAGDQPGALARVATRAEMRQPGTLERTFNRVGPIGGMGMGGMLAGSFLGAMAGTVLGTAIANSFLESHGDTAAGDHAAADASDTGPDGGFGDANLGGGDFGSDSFDV